MRLMICILFLTILSPLSGCDSDSDNLAPVGLTQEGEIQLVVLRGNYREMGRQYGLFLTDSRHELYSEAIETIYISEKGYIPWRS